MELSDLSGRPERLCPQQIKNAYAATLSGCPGRASVQWILRWNWACPERTIRRYIERAKVELADDWHLRSGDWLGDHRAEVDDLLRANLRELERLQEGPLTVPQRLSILRERRAIAETLMRLTGSAEMMQ